MLVANKADKPAPLVKAVYYLKREYLEAFLLNLQNACAKFTETHYAVSLQRKPRVRTIELLGATGGSALASLVIPPMAET